MTVLWSLIQVSGVRHRCDIITGRLIQVSGGGRWGRRVSKEWRITLLWSLIQVGAVRDFMLCYIQK